MTRIWERRVRRSARRTPWSRPRCNDRIIGFLRASWAELQRVQWPDRQQVAQATGVVLGFVVITGIFLGVADYLAGKLINFII
jgi:preprotein translocase subunit SecE